MLHTSFDPGTFNARHSEKEKEIELLKKNIYIYIYIQIIINNNNKKGGGGGGGDRRDAESRQVQQYAIFFSQVLMRVTFQCQGHVCAPV